MKSAVERCIVFPLAIAVTACWGSSEATRPSGDFKLDCTASPTSGMSPLTVFFTAHADNVDGDVEYSWLFGDGTAASTAEASRVFVTGGVFDAVVTAHSGSLVSTCSQKVTVDSAIRIDLCAASPTEGPIPLDVDFASRVNGGTGVYGYSWEFGDGGSSNEASPHHTFTQPGTFTVRLTVHSGSLFTSSATTVHTYERLKVGCSVEPSEGYAPLVVAFSAKVPDDLVKPRFTWSFGDGNIAHKRDFVYVYNNPGTYSVLLSVTSGTKEGQCHRSVKVNP
jgi:PKD repeat protein